MSKYGHLEVYTDGATSRNGQSDAPGGWAYAVYDGEVLIQADSGHLQNTTNQRAEMTAIIEALNFLNNLTFFSASIMSDSAYCINAFNAGWLTNWKRNGWMTAKNEPVKNKDLWEALLIAHNKNEKMRFIKVKGHSDDKRNAFVDALAVRAKGE